MDTTSLSEFALIARLTSGLTTRPDVTLGVGDDCAILDLDLTTSLLATCDSQVEGIHFTLHTSSPEQIGRKALAINLSDIAAMGGVPRYALVSLIIPSQFPIATIESLYTGLRAEAERFEVAVVGGNIAGADRSTPLIIDITVLGTVERGRAIRRDGAQAGDLLCVTGFLGDSAAGLYTLLHPDHPYPQPALEHVRAIHRQPHPRVCEGQVLSSLASGMVTAMLDISDGLSGDLAHLCERSHVGARLDLPSFPLSPSLLSIAKSAAHDPFHWAMHGGEDYELLFTVAATHAQNVIDTIRETTGTPVTIIGTILPAEDGIIAHYSNGHEEPLAVESWDHLKA